MLTKTGAKLLDFGLAKLRDPVRDATASLDRAVDQLHPKSGLPVRAALSTQAPGLTQTGALLGTFAYMAPEQVQGRDSGERADIFAFGAIVYEAVSGRKPFDASTAAGVLGAVLMSDPPALAARPEVPALLDLVVRRCLAKEPDERWQSIRDVLPMLQWTLQGLDSPTSARNTRRQMTLVLATAVGLALVSLGMWLWTAMARPTAPDPRVGRWDVAVPSGQLATELFPSLALSPDSTRLAFSLQTGAATQLYMRHADRFEAEPIAGTAGAHTPFFSPTGEWLGFLANGNVYRVSVNGGSPVLVCGAPSLSPASPGATWGTEGTIVFAAGASGLMRVSDAGGRPEVLTEPDPERGEVSHIAPQFLPGGDLLFTVRTADDGWRLALLPRGSQRWYWLPAIGELAGARYVSTGHVIYAQGGGLHAIPLDVTKRGFAGAARPLSETVYTRVVGDAILAQFTSADNGVLALISGRPPDWQLQLVSRSGEERPLTNVPHLYRYPRISPDGSRIAVTVEEERADIHVVDRQRGTIRKLTRTGSNTVPAWTPDSKRVTFSARRVGSNSYDLFWMPIDESADAEPLLTRDGVQLPSGWSPSGRGVLLYEELSNATARDIWAWSAADKSVTPVVATPASERGAVFSPDGHWIAYVSNESGSDEIYVQKYPGPGGREVVSQNGGTEPVWSSDGQELFYRHGAGVMAVRVRTSPGFVAESPRTLFEGDFVLSPTGRPNYDVTPDGRSFVMVRSMPGATAHLHIVQNWTQQLKTGR
jgi:hypothetical protein